MTLQTASNYISDKRVAAHYDISRATVWRWVQAGRLPKPIKLSPGCTRWRASDIELWKADTGGEVQ